jgi:protein-S-isoprenylcysteine O-methyltransferase Ste14
MSNSILAAVAASSAILVGALILSIAKPTVGVWPAPREHERAWRARLVVHRIAGVLVALTGAGALALALLDRGSLHLPAGFRWIVGPAVLAFGALFGLWGYVRLGANASLGAMASLEASGPYRYSRNPQYVGAIGVLLGFALLCASELGLLAGAASSIWFVTAPFAEEPWLRRHLGARYDEYVKSSPRFLGCPSRGRGDD